MRRASAKREPFVLGSKEEKQIDVQSESQGAVCTGADWFLSTLAPTPTATSQIKYKQTENSARMHFIEGNNNILILFV